MERIKPLRRYTLIDEHRNALHLFLGQEDGHAKMSKDKGFRWMFKGHKIPMPVRSETWFNGFPVDTMLDWLKRNGWTLHSELNLATSRLTVYKYVCVTEIDKGNGWIPVSSGEYPKNEEVVQVTYLGYPNEEPVCGMAYLNMGVWRWDDDGSPVKVEITAWRYCEPYKGNDK
jgi:hypothetical protein